MSYLAYWATCPVMNIPNACADTKPKDIWLTDIILTDIMPIYIKTESQDTD